MIKKFDLIFSLGEACSCTQALREYNLQIYSYPFDWLSGSDFLLRCNILANGFKDFIKKEDLQYCCENRNIKCVAYKNKKNNLTFNHDFLKEMPFDNAYNYVKEKYKRRIKRLLNKINKSKAVLVVYMEIPTRNHQKTTNEEIIKGYSILQEAYKNKINLLYIKNESQNYTVEFLENNKVTVISKDYKNYNSKQDYVADIGKLKDIFAEYKLNLPIFYIKIRKIIKYLLDFIPIKSKRHKLKKLLLCLRIFLN